MNRTWKKPQDWFERVDRMTKVDIPDDIADKAAERATEDATIRETIIDSVRVALHLENFEEIRKKWL